MRRHAILLAALALLLAGARAASAATLAPPPGTAGSALAPTPYMGWDSYYAFAGKINESTILTEAHELVASGLAADGYRLVWLDVGWWQGQRASNGQIEVSATQWPHGLAWLTSTLHAEGLKVGIYTDVGTTGCGGPGTGSYGHYQQDVNTLAAWGFDAIKVDFCGGTRLGLDPRTAYTEFHDAIVDNASHRPIIFNICNFLQPSQINPTTPAITGSGFFTWTYAPSIATSWRTDTDIGVPGNVTFASVLRNMDADAAHPQAAGPGHWNDPDYLAPDQGMSATQFRSQLSMWAILAAPLMISDNLTTMSAATEQALANREAIAIDQDPAGIQGTLAADSGSSQVWVKPLSDGSRAVALLNRGSAAAQITASAVAVGLPRAGRYDVRDVWAHRTTTTTGTLTALVPGDGTDLLRVSVAPPPKPRPKRKPKKSKRRGR
ncbi:MAG TPA: glycoside hydrolase family 27 protein [Solirubrobacteraceae bacterium]|jgi:alpha-galactosidase|nr:glycoside hydrolase family 27 protein [Solirubrobacteraceae bacterium]